MDRRSFIISTSSLLAILSGGRIGQAADAQPDPRDTKGNTKFDPKDLSTGKGVLPFVPGSWTIAIMPDTQHYCTRFPGLFRLQTEWIAANKKDRNIVYALQNGDVTNNNSKHEWSRAQRAFSALDNVVPYAICPGNHDYHDSARQSRETRINDYFPPSRFKDWSTFGGTMEEGRIENNFHLFEGGGRKWIAIALEWGPRDKALQWADGLLTKYADRKAIVFTHAYLYSDSTRYDWAVRGESQNWNPHSYGTPGSVNDGEEMWQKVLKKHGNLFMVMNGHVCHDGLGFQVSKGDKGNLVNEMLVDFQIQETGGGAWMRLLELLPDGKTVQAKTYSPFYELYNVHKDNQFTMQLADAS